MGRLANPSCRHARNGLAAQIAKWLAVICAISILNQITVPAKDFRRSNQELGSSGQSVAISLQPGAPIERELTGGEQNLFSVQLEAGRFVRISLNQGSSVLQTRVTAPNGEKILEGLTPNSFSEIARFSFISSEAGAYRIEIAHARKEASRSRYEIRIEELREAKNDDPDRALADRFSMEAGALIAMMSASNLKSASEKYRNALELWRRVHARYETAQTLLTLGSIANNLSQSTVALDYYYQALPIWRELNDRRKEAQTLSALGWTYFGSGDFPKALENYNQALPIRRELADLKGQAQTLTTLGQVYSSLGEPQLASENYTESLTLARRAGDKIQQAFALNNFAYMYANVGEYQKGLNCLTEAAPLWKEVGNRYGEADALNCYGIIYDRLGDYDQALAHYKQGLDIWRFLGNRGGEADALNNIGVAMLNRWSAEEPEALRIAIDYLNQALEIRRAIGQRLGEDSTLVSLGVAYQYLGQTQKALGYFKEILDRDPQSPWALYGIGFNHFLLRDFRQAMVYLKQALPLFKARENREGEAQTLRLLAGSLEEMGELIEARDNARKALAIIESSRSRVVSPETRMKYRGHTSSYPVLLIDILSKMHLQHPDAGYDAEAFEVSEKARARGLLEMLLQARVDLSKDADPATFAREHALELQLNAKEQYRTRLLETKGREAELATAETDLASITNQYQQARSLLLKSNPNFAALTEPKTLSVAETQALMDHDTILLEYRLGEDQSFLWAVSANSFVMYLLPQRDLIQGMARQVYDLLTARNLHQPGESPSQRAARLALAEADLASTSARLSRILIGPVAATLGKKRLVIVSEDWLQYIPFGALPNPATNMVATAKGPKTGPPLMFDHEIVNLPSASVLGVLRRDDTKRQTASKAIAVFADPVYNRDDPRVKANLTALPAASMQQDGSSENGSTSVPLPAKSPTARYGRLRFSRDEAQNIIAFAPRASSLEALDFAANKQTVLTANLAQYRILHFATHGLLDTQRPELSGLALSFMAEDGQSLDGYLRLKDIYKLKLNADLVVLSGCQTALGKDLKGEGLLGLTRGFMYAGVPRVIASLWSVDDRATSELMKRFYRGILLEGMRPAAALRAAQMSLFVEQGWKSPYYWAPFTLQGEWK